MGIVNNTSMNIDVDIKYQKIIRDLLKKHLPNTEVWAYGSRVKWSSNPQSDLDMVTFATKEQRLAISNLKEAFEESSLPFKVDLFVWDEVPEQFHENIKEEHVVLQAKEEKKIAPYGWKETTLGEEIYINPLRSIKKGVIAPKIPMDVLNTNDRSINGFEETVFTGSGTKFKNGDTLLARITPCLENGKTAYVDCLKENEVAFGSTEYIVMTGKKNITDNLFVYYLTRDPQFRGYAIAHMEGSSGRQRVPADAVKKYEINLPPLPEQQAIAEVLGSLDDKIELNRKMNKTLENMAQAIFKSWFVDTEENFKQDKLVDDFNITMGQSPSGDTYNEDKNGLPFYQGSRDFTYRYPSLRIWCSSPCRLANAGDTLMSVRAPVGALNMAIEKCCIGRGLSAIRHKSGSRSYTYYFMQNIVKRISSTSTDGTVFDSINKITLENLNIIIPPVGLIKEFEEKVFPIDEKIEANCREIQILTNLRDTLLPKLISGELRIPDAIRHC